MGVSSAIGQTPPIPRDAFIRLERTSCFGACPIYSVTIDATGLVAYEGVNFVRVKGRQTARVPLARVAALLETADRIGFFGLSDRYHVEMTDNLTTFVTITRSGRTKTVEDREVGSSIRTRRAGAPPASDAVPRPYPTAIQRS